MSKCDDVDSIAQNSKEACGQRLKYLRGLTGTKDHKPLSRAAIERKYELSAHTLRNWEEATASGLTEKGARIIIDIYQRENINCSVSWLLAGKGNSPYRRQSAEVSITLVAATDIMETIKKECEYFKSLHPEAVILEVRDDAMAPQYQPGDIVGGIRHYHKNIPNLIGKDCIVETKEGNVWLRKLHRSTVPDQYNLYSLNPDSKIERPTLYGVEVATCAPVKRIWRGKKW